MFYDIINSNLNNKLDVQYYDTIYNNNIKSSTIIKYYMGWKFNTKNINNNKNNNKNKKKIKNIKCNKSNNLNNLNIIKNVNLENNKPTEYNIHNEFPYYFPEIVNQGNINCCVPLCISLIYYYL